jgi:hypothetical protein
VNTLKDTGPVKDGSAKKRPAPSPEPVACVAIIDSDPPDWVRDVLTGSQVAVDSNLFRWRKLVRAAPHLRANAKLLALVIADYCGKQDAAWPSMARLGADTSLSRNTIIRATTDLERNGFLVVARDGARGRSRKANIYYPAWPVAMEAEFLLRPVVTVSPMTPGSASLTPGSATSEPGGSATSEPEVVIPKSLGKSQSSLSGETCEIFDAFVTLLGREPATASERKEWEKAAQDLANSDVTPRQVSYVRDAWEWQNWDYKITPGAIARNWSLLDETMRTW